MPTPLQNRPLSSRRSSTLLLLEHRQSQRYSNSFFPTEHEATSGGRVMIHVRSRVKGPPSGGPCLPLTLALRTCGASAASAWRRFYLLTGFISMFCSPTSTARIAVLPQSWLQAAARLCRVDDELSGRLDGITFPRWRKESLKAYGNAIVPAVALEIFRSLRITHLQDDNQ